MGGKIKTLKDIEPFNDLNPRFVNRDKLKQEAIKCFKELEELKESHYFDKRDFFQNNFQENPVVVLRFLEWFFNLTKEDLK